MSELDWDNMSDEERVNAEKRENRQIRRKSRGLRSAIIDKIAKGQDSEEFPNVDGSSKQTYAIVTVLDGLDRDVQESEKALAAKEGSNDAGAMVTAIFEGIIDRMGDPSEKFAQGERGMRTVGNETQRLRPGNEASSQHMHTGRDEIEYAEVFHKDGKK